MHELLQLVTEVGVEPTPRRKQSDEENHQILNLLHQNREETRTYEEHKLAFQSNDEFFNKLLTIKNRKRKNDEN